MPKVARCPLCPDVPSAYFAIVRSPQTALDYHMKQEHNVTITAIITTKCPCPPTATCGAHIETKYAARKEAGDCSAHAGERCERCNIWWTTSKAAKVRIHNHPCVPYDPGCKFDPWPIRPAPVPDDKRENAAATKKQGVSADLTQSTDSSAEPTQKPVQATTKEQADADRREQTTNSTTNFRSGEGGPARLPPLAAATVRNLRVLAEASVNNARALTRRGLAHDTRLDHVRMLKSVAEAAREERDDKELDGPVAEWCLKLLTKRGRIRNWAWSTQQSAMATLQSALKYLPVYVRGAPSWRLYEDQHWALASRAVRNRASATLPDQALPATTENVLKACQHAMEHDKPQVAAVMAMTWLTCSRTGSVLGAKFQDVIIERDRNKQWTMTLTLLRGKSNRLGQGPHTVGPVQLMQFEKYVLPILQAQSNPTDFIVHLPTPTAKTNFLASVNDTLRAANDGLPLENRSLRRGSLQTLARSGAQNKTLLAFSGHSSVKSLKRYLNFGRVPAADQMEASHLIKHLAAVETPDEVRQC